MAGRRWVFVISGVVSLLLGLAGVEWWLRRTLPKPSAQIAPCAECPVGHRFGAMPLLPWEPVPDGVLVVGDSLTAGDGVKETERWTHLASVQTGIALHNRALSGLGASEIALSLPTLLQDRTRAVVYGAYLNDHLPLDLIQVEDRVYWVGPLPWRQISTSSQQLFQHSMLASWSFGAWASRRYNSLRDAELRGDLHNLEKAVLDMKALCDSRGIGFYVLLLVPHVMGEGDNPMVPDDSLGATSTELERGYREVFERAGVAHHSTLSAIRATGRSAYLKHRPKDWVHPNAEGHELIAAEFVKASRSWSALR